MEIHVYFLDKHLPPWTFQFSHRALKLLEFEFTTQVFQAQDAIN